MNQPTNGTPRAPGERFEWLETEKPTPKAPTEARGVQAQPARRCRRCGWLDSVTEAECFRCGESFPDAHEHEALPADTPPLPRGTGGVRVALTPAKALLAHGTANAAPPTWLLRRRSANFSLVPDFSSLLSLSEVNREVFHRYAHQQAVARTALQEMGGAALLADETGLGKTIEAGLVAKELLMRGLVQTVLVVVPASLGNQWHEEMHEKFGLEFVVAREAADLKDDPPLVIVSYAGLRGSSVGKKLRERSVDLLICDEAHHLKNRATKQYKAVSRVTKKFVLLLSATPFHNRLIELKNLMDILKPGLLGSTRAFNKQYVDEKDPRKPRNLHHLRELLAEVMIRNRRQEVAIKLPARRAATYHIELGPEEQTLYDELSSFIGGEVRSRTASMARPGERPMSMVLSLITLQRELCSSPYAVAKGLENLANSQAVPLDVCDRIATHARQARALGGTWRKAVAVEELLEKFPGKVVVFCEFRATIDELIKRLEADGIETQAFHGGMNPKARSAALKRFKDSARVLIASRAGAEGLNIQFCSTVINFDLPWNPMIVEQRIGRVHRLGQTKEVTVLNLSVKGTIEARILELLTHKLRLFTAVLGEVDLILGALHSERSFDELLREAWLKGAVDENIDSAFDEFGKQLESAREQYDKIKEGEAILDTLREGPTPSPQVNA